MVRLLAHEYDDALNGGYLVNNLVIETESLQTFHALSIVSLPYQHLHLIFHLFSIFADLHKHRYI